MFVLISLVIVLISAVLGAHFSYSSQGFFMSSTVLCFSGSVLSSRATLSSENACF